MFNYLKSKSPITYPFIDMLILRRQFFRKSNLKDVFGVQEFEFDIIIKQMGFVYEQNDPRIF